VFFPRLYQPNKRPAIPSEIRTLIYEKCLRPAVIDINPICQSRWPIDYSAVMTLYRDKKGLFHFGSIDFPACLLGKLGTKLRDLFQMHEGLQDAFFVHEIKGTKGASHHDPNNKGDRDAALDDVLDLLDRGLIRSSEWVIDVGIEIRQESHVLQWLTRGHRRILEFLLPSATEDHIEAILSSSAQYHQDINGQLGDLSGFRASPSSRGKADSVIYINVYTTEKSATYQLHEGIYRRRKAWHLFPDTIGKLVKDLGRIAEFFKRCGGSQNHDGQEGNARMEIRIPLSKVDSALVDLPHSLVENAIVSFECQNFW
jgi:hypothetical protein